MLRARFEDAQFFYDADLRQPLAAFAPKLAGTQFHRDLGSLAQKTERVTQLIAPLAAATGLTGALPSPACVLPCQLHVSPGHQQHLCMICMLATAIFCVCNVAWALSDVASVASRAGFDAAEPGCMHGSSRMQMWHGSYLMG